MLVQAEHYADNDYWICHEMIERGPAAYFGGCMWHGADHSRGYHPDNFFGGVLSYDRRKKYSWYAMKARLTKEPFVYLANALAFYSPQTITIFSNCAYTATWLGRPVKNGDRLDRGLLKRLNYEIVDQGEKTKHRLPELDFVITLANGTAITNNYASRFSGIDLELDTEGLPPVGDGSDLVVCRARLVDAKGVVRRYQTEDVVFSAEGPVQIVGENPQRTRFGEASVLLRPLSAGSIKITASVVRTGRGAGVRVPNGGVLTLTALPADGQILAGKAISSPVCGPLAVRRTESETSLKEVEDQQREFMR